MTAPNVPPITIMKAVSCMIEPRCPPSSTCPPRMAPRDTTIPIMVRRSIRLFPYCWVYSPLVTLTALGDVASFPITSNRVLKEELSMSLAADNLVLQAKTAILEDQVRRFQAFQKDGKWEEALQQFHSTLQCAADVLQGSLKILAAVAQREPPQQAL